MNNVTKTCVLNILRSNNFLQRSLSTVAPEIRIYEVGPRDGLQNESKFVPTDIKVELISKIVAAGIKNVESASFVSPKWVKQMSDSVDVMKNIQRVPGVNYPVLVPNLKGYETAKQCNVEEIAIFPAGSEGFSQKNLNCSVEEGLRRFKQVADEAVRDGLRVRGYISCVVGCPYDGPIHPKNIAKTHVNTTVPSSRQILNLTFYNANRSPRSDPSNDSEATSHAHTHRLRTGAEQHATESRTFKLNRNRRPRVKLNYNTLTRPSDSRTVHASRSSVWQSQVRMCIYTIC
uniref:hydroxymethylglutaryl-CoA lyase n=1 Tax=Bombyx mori TaxID=7091 RepID=A0A8R2QTF1_BOMMO|nr:hydroxymethylglutaryl-CoA lyase isoform X1 [Bombyx mori]